MSLLVQDPHSSHSRTSSVNSHSPSLQSAAASTRYMLAGMNSPLDPPAAPFANRHDSQRSFSLKDSPLMSSSGLPESPSLSVNYLPSKFSNAVITKRRKNGKGGGYLMPKQGGGREAFRSNESRMPGENDDDYDGVDMFGAKEGGRTKSRGHWNRFKWILFVANTVVSVPCPSSCSLSASSQPLFLVSQFGRASAQIPMRTALPLGPN